MATYKSFWQQLDEALCKFVDEKMGENSAYEDLKLAQKTKAVVLHDFNDFEEWASGNQTPAAVVQGRFAEYAIDQHGTGGLLAASAYPYTVTAIVAGTEDHCREVTKVLLERMIGEFSQKLGFSVTVGTVTKSYFISFGTGGVHVWPKHDGQVGQFYGICAFSLRLFDGNSNAR